MNRVAFGLSELYSFALILALAELQNQNYARYKLHLPKT